MQLDKIVEKAEQYFVDVVENGSDQALFIAGYVQGHFSLGLAKLQSCQTQSAEQLKAIIDKNLDQAFADKELEEPDQQQSRKLVATLFSR
jgi:predicted chitinase